MEAFENVVVNAFQAIEGKGIIEICSDVEELEDNHEYGEENSPEHCYERRRVSREAGIVQNRA